MKELGILIAIAIIKNLCILSVLRNKILFMSNILIVDDKADIRDLVSDILTDEGYHTIAVSSAAKAIEAVKQTHFATAILDIWLEGSEMDGIGILKTIKNLSPDTSVVMISGHGNIETAVETIKLGAYDFIEKPFKAEKLKIIVERAVNNHNLITENNQLKQQHLASTKYVGQSKATATLLKAAGSAAASNSRIIITGESGTGKEMLARHIHSASERKSKPFHVLYAASITEDNFNDEVFGTELKPGLLDRAEGGTIYIDELAEMSQVVQSKFLKILQDTKYNFRVIAGSSKNLQAMAESGAINSSLYYRLNVVPLYIDPLRNRAEDLACLIEHFVTFFSTAMKLGNITFSENALSALQIYDWPGNVRELKNVIEWVMIMKAKDKSVIERDDLPAEIQHNLVASNDDNWIADSFSKPIKDARDDFEKKYLEAQLQKFNGNISKTAEYVGMERTALHRKMKALSL